jgi:HD-GYP domain-containing protein (c-di-GMP phosphodiesterase class II)
MNLVVVQIDSIRIGQALPFALRDSTGVLLAPKGFVVEKRADLDLMITQRGRLFIDASESEGHHRAYVEKLHTLVREDQSLGVIAETGVASSSLAGLKASVEVGEPDWVFLQAQTAGMLRDPSPASFSARVDKLHTLLVWHLRHNPDGVLFALIHLSAREVHQYSATHAMLVSVMCSLAAHEVLKWSPEAEVSLGKAALTMNLGMTELQDRLARQKEAPSPLQRKEINAHAQVSVSMLKTLGITDPIWLEAVADHHTKVPGPLAGRTPGQRLARLIQRADMFAACLAPRVTRAAVAPGVAMKASYFDENKQIDEAGASLIKVVGIYTPGSYVRLATNEIAVVIKRGANTTTPRVAVLVSRSGLPTAEHMVRDTSQAEFKITASVPHREVKVQINLPKMLAMTKPAPSERPR